MYHTNPAINDTVLTIINDGNGDQCGMSYKQRCAAAEYGIMAFRSACRTYRPELKRTEVIEAATIIQEYYREHMREIT